VALLRTTSDGDSDNDIKQKLTSVPIGLLVKHQHGILDLQIVRLADLYRVSKLFPDLSRLFWQCTASRTF